MCVRACVRVVRVVRARVCVWCACVCVCVCVQHHKNIRKLLTSQMMHTHITPYAQMPPICIHTTTDAHTQPVCIHTTSYAHTQPICIHTASYAHAQTCRYIQMHTPVHTHTDIHHTYDTAPHMSHKQCYVVPCVPQHVDNHCFFPMTPFPLFLYFRRVCV